MLAFLRKRALPGIEHRRDSYQRVIVANGAPA
jgi:hypothetical protein